MLLLTATDLSRQFDREPVFKGVTFDLRSGERVGLVGPNGTGKTTLMHCLTGKEHPDTGGVTMPKDADIGLLAQEAHFPPGRTLIEEVKAGLKHLYDLHRESEELGHKMAEVWEGPEAEKLHKRFDYVQEALTRHDAFELDYKVDEVLTGLGFTPDQHDMELESMSGGQRSRAILARLLLSSPDVMLLDEPTNHLDIAGTEWLESFLPRHPGAVLLVSHDRYFLDAVTTRTLELWAGTLSDYKGNFSTYRAQRDERVKVLERTAGKQAEEIARTEKFIAKNKAGQKTKQAQSREKKLAKMERVEVPVYDERGPAMSFGAADRTGDLVLEAKGLSKTYDDLTLFKNVSLRVGRGDRVGLVGPNGCGKTTLIRCLLDEEAVDAGTVRLGAGVKVGYFDQRLDSVPPDMTAVEAVRPPDAHVFNPGPARGQLARFGVRGEMAEMKVGAMSGGEKTRVALARLAVSDANVLVLDEPTNHLDLWSRDALERALKAFEGTLLFVSHDRFFMDQIADRVLVRELNGEGEPVWREHEGNYSEYAAFRAGRDAELAAEREQAPAPAKQSGGSPSASNAKAKKFPYRKPEAIEADIAETEAHIAELERKMSDPAVLKNGGKIRRVRDDHADAKAELSRLWEHLEEVMA